MGINDKTSEEDELEVVLDPDQDTSDDEELEDDDDGDEADVVEIDLDQMNDMEGPDA